MLLDIPVNAARPPVVVKKWRTGIRHKVDDKQLVAGTVEYLNQTAPDWVAFAARSNGDVHQFSRHGTMLSQDKVQFSLNLLQHLHEEFRESGMCWIICWRSSGLCAMVNKDYEGDINLEVEIEDSWERVRQAPVEKFVDDALAAFRKWADQERRIGITSDQKRALALAMPFVGWKH